MTEGGWLPGGQADRAYCQPLRTLKQAAESALISG